MKISSFFGAIVAFVLFASSYAAACPPPPPPPPQDALESEADYAVRVAAWQAAQDAQHAAWLHERQQRLWDQAESVFLARVVRVRPAHHYMLGDIQRVTLQSVRAIKGRAYRNRFSLTHTDATSCGPIPGFAAVSASLGDEFVVFVRGGRPSQDTVQNTIAASDLTDERIRAALEAANAPR